jgi:hypothetical protein
MTEPGRIGHLLNLFLFPPFATGKMGVLTVAATVFSDYLV